MSGSEGASGEEGISYAGWRVAAASSIGVFVSFASVLVYTFGIFLKPLTEEFGWSRQAASLAFGIAAMSVAACSPPLGLLLDRFGTRRVVLPCLTVFGCAFASLSLLTAHLAHLYAVFVVLGVVGNGTAQMAFSRAVSSWFVRRRGMALGLLMAGGATGSILLPPVTQALIDGIGWRGAFAVLGGMVLALGLPVVTLLVRDRPGMEPRTVAASSGAPLPVALGSRAFWLLVLVLFFTSIGQNGALTHLSALLTDRGIASGAAAMTLSAMGVASLAGRVFTGWLLDRFFGPRVSLGLLVVAAIGMFLLADARSLAAGCVAAALIGVGMGGEADVTPYLLTRYFGFRSFSTLYGLTWTAYAIAGAIGPVLMGKAFDRAASYETFVWQAATLMLASAGLMLFMPAYPVQSRSRNRMEVLTPEKGLPSSSA